MRPLALLPLLFTAALAAPPNIFVAYPPNPYTVAFDHVLLEGSVPAGASLNVNGQPAQVGPDGLFILWQPLKPGTNVLKLSSRLAGETASRAVTVSSRPPATPSATPTRLLAPSLTPDQSITLYTLPDDPQARTVTVRFQGSPGGRASFRVGNRGPFAMTGGPGGVYQGQYLVQSGDRFTRAPISVQLTGLDRRTVQATAKGTLSVQGGGPRVGVERAETLGRGVNPSTTVWTGRTPDDFLVFPQTGIRSVVIGEEGDRYLLRLGRRLTAHVPKGQLRLLPGGTPLPAARPSGVSTRSTPGHLEIRLALSGRVPFRLEQRADEGGQDLDLRLYHASGHLTTGDDAATDDLLRGLSWTQEEPDVARLHLTLNLRQQWGFDASYEGNTLVLRVRRPPNVDADRPLAGHRILIDPGHGGSARGAVGALQVDEKSTNLAIGLALAERLRTLGAEVTLSRESDVEVGLYARPIKAEETGAEVLVSIHGNGLPDGSDPRRARGVGLYTYWPQARPLAGAILNSIQRTLPEVGSDGLHEKSLALTRPSTQLSLLIETAFFTDPQNLRTLMNPGGQGRFAGAIAQGIEDFYRAAR